MDVFDDQGYRTWTYSGRGAGPGSYQERGSVDVFDDQGYAWIETTTPADASDGRRTFQRGMKLKPDVQPWTIDTNAGPRVAWIDDQNQEHFMPPDVDVTRRGWRRLYVEKRS